MNAHLANLLSLGISEVPNAPVETVVPDNFMGLFPEPEETAPSEIQEPAAALPIQESVMQAVVEEPIVLAVAATAGPIVTVTPVPIVDARFATPLAGALTLAAMGIPQIPVFAGQKNAFLKDWQNLATTDPAQIETWAKQHNCNFGSVAKAEIGGFWFLELDENGLAKRIADETKQQLPITLLVRSRQSRGHLYFRQNLASISLGNVSQTQVKGAGFSVRVHNEYVVSPGSFRSDLNRSYEPVQIVEIAEAPQWLIAWIQKQRVTADPTSSSVSQVIANKTPLTEGKRNTTLFKIACKWRGDGISEEGILEELRRYNDENCDPRLPDDEVQSCARSASKHPEGDPVRDMVFMDSTTSSVDLDDAISFESFDGEEWELQEWLWHGRIPCGALTLYAGNPDAGKTTAALDLIARITRGMEFPNGEVNDFPPSDCILCEAEDSRKKTIGPKLAVAAEDAGADMSRVTEMKFKVKGDTQRKRNLQLSNDLGKIEEEIAKRPNVRLLVISPISAYLGPGIKAIDDGAVRAILGQLQDMAERLNIAVVAVIHLNKSSDYDVIYRVSGAMGFVAVARASWLFALDKDPKSDKRYMMPIKGNLAEKQKSVVYRIALSEKTVPLKDRRNECTVQKQMPRIYWGETAEIDANEMMRASAGFKPKDMMPEALAWLSRLFRDPTNFEVLRRVSLEEFRKAERAVSHIPMNTMKRAKRQLGVNWYPKTRDFAMDDPQMAEGDTPAVDLNSKN